MRIPSLVTILIADDDADDCMMAKEAFDECRLANPVDFVEDGVDLLAYLRGQGRYADSPRRRPGIIILDLNMPKMDGREALGEIKADPVLRRIPVVVMTTSKAEEDIYRTYDLGVNSFITKPVTFDGSVAVMRAMGAYWIGIVQLPDADRAARTALMNEDRLRILLVDDDEDDYILTYAVLNEFYGDQIDVEWASSYELSQRGAHERPPRVVPSGLPPRIADRARAAPRDRRRAAARRRSFCSRATTTANTDVEAMEAGAADYLDQGTVRRLPVGAVDPLCPPVRCPATVRARAARGIPER